MIVKISFVILLSVTLCSSCSNKVTSIDNGTLIGGLSDEIKSFIKEMDTKYQYPINEKRIVSISFLEDDSLNCLINISSDFFYDSNKVKGYTFIDDNLIVFYDLNNSCSDNIINKKNIFIFKDSILGYKDYSRIDLEYKIFSRLYKVVDNDSLVLINKK